MEQVPGLVAARGSITTWAITWAIAQLRREHATIQGLARRLGTSWKTLWRTVCPSPSASRTHYTQTERTARFPGNTRESVSSLG